MIAQYIKEHLNGILGTIIFHLILLISFLFVKISTIDKSGESRFIIEIEEPIEMEEEKLEVEKEKLEKLLPGLDREVRRNIAVNTARQVEEEISTEKYIEQLKKELNISDPPDNWKEQLEAQYAKPEKNEEKKKTDDQEFSGLTNIEYYLENRTDRYIHVPVYKCEGSGMVTIQIVVSQQGEVLNTSVDSKATTVTDPCFIEEATRAAKKSHFNPDINAPVRQKGTITYNFIAQ